MWKDSSITLPASSWGSGSVQWSPWKFLGVIVFYSAEFSQCRMGAWWWWICTSEFSNYLLLITFHSAKVMCSQRSGASRQVVHTAQLSLCPRGALGANLQLRPLAALPVPLKKKRAISMFYAYFLSQKGFLHILSTQSWCHSLFALNYLTLCYLYVEVKISKFHLAGNCKACKSIHAGLWYKQFWKISSL